MRPSFTGTDRVARTIAVLLALIAVASVTTAWLIQRNGSDERAAVSDSVPDSLSTESASDYRPGYTAAPIGDAHSPAANDATSAPRSTPAAKLVVHPISPKQLYVPSIDVNTKITPKPTEMAHDPFLNKTVPSFGVPDDLYTTTWWSSGPKPGATGMAVVLGHTQIGGYGVFNNLAKLKKSQVIGVANGATTLRFEVMAVHTGISKKDPQALQTVLENHPASARLALLTCSGDFNQSYRESAENTVVFAKLVSVGH